MAEDVGRPTKLDMMLFRKIREGYNLNMKNHNCGIEDCTCPINGECKCPSNYDHNLDNSPEYNRFLQQMGHDMSKYDKS